MIDGKACIEGDDLLVKSVFKKVSGNGYFFIKNAVCFSIKNKGYAMAVRNYKGIRCEVRGLPGALRASNWGDYYPGY